MDPKVFREQAVKDAKCNLILDAAQGIFAEKGYMNARLEDIAAAAGFSKPTLYSYYEDKEAIFLSLAIREMENMTRKIESVTSTDGTFIATLESIMRIIFENFTQTSSYFSTVTNFQALGAVQAEMSKHHEIMGRFHEIVGSSVGLMEKVVHRARKNGEISDTHESNHLAWTILSLIQSVHMRSWMTRKACDVDSSVKELIYFIMNGISVKNKKADRV